MIRLDFGTSDRLLDFINSTTEFLGYETVIFRIGASNSVQMNIQTEVNDSLGLRQYIELAQLKSTMTQFASQNSHLTINIEIKLKFPDDQRKIMDPTDAYDSLYLNFYADDSYSYATISYIENSATLTTSPIISWGIYVTSLYNDWKKRIGEY